MGLSITELLPPRVDWATIRLILQTYKIATYLYFHPIRAENYSPISLDLKLNGIF